MCVDVRRCSKALLAALVLSTAGRTTQSFQIAPDISSVHIKSQGKTLFGRIFSPALESASSKAPGVFMLHGIPGTEQNFDVAYALRDAGFVCLLWHYRGCWGSQGSYSIDGLPLDIEAAFR
jgi:pimeloyl-ACP methyl ester carboxylesterase